MDKNIALAKFAIHRYLYSEIYENKKIHFYTKLIILICKDKYN